MRTLREAIIEQTNDYSPEESAFLGRTGLNLVSLDTNGLPAHDSYEAPTSVIISCYEGHRTLPLMLRQLGRQSIKNFEVIVVDDGSPTTMLPVVENAEPEFPVKYIREVENRGRSFTRNTGMLAAEGDNLIFTDQDIIFDERFIEGWAVRQAHTSDCVFIGFKQDVDLDKLDTSPWPDYQKDWRNSINVREGFIAHGLPQDDPMKITARKYRILAETNNLKEFGHGRTIGGWNLASTVISHGMSVDREAALAAGGFPEKEFDGWGAQDTAFGARLIGQGNFIVPSLDTAYFHINHPRYSGSREEELEELNANMAGYKTLLDSKDFAKKPENRKIAKVATNGNIEYYEV